MNLMQKNLTLSAAMIAILGMSTGEGCSQVQVSSSNNIVAQPSDKFRVAANMPSGAKMALVQGDPNKVGAFTLQLKLPKCYTLPPHIHNSDETVTVVAGSVSFGRGGVIKKAQSKTLTKGQKVQVPARSNHYAWSTQDDTIVQIEGHGPRTTTYLNPNEYKALLKGNTQCPQG